MYETPSLLPQLLSTILFFGLLFGSALVVILILAVQEKPGSRASMTGGFLAWLARKFRAICFVAVILYCGGAVLGFLYLEAPFIGWVYLVFTAIYAGGWIWHSATDRRTQIPSA
jgi:hypothetical protein